MMIGPLLLTSIVGAGFLMVLGLGVMRYVLPTALLAVVGAIVFGGYWQLGALLAAFVLARPMKRPGFPGDTLL